jgi:hypothetical protein
MVRSIGFPFVVMAVGFVIQNREQVIALRNRRLVRLLVAGDPEHRIGIADGAIIAP